MIIERPSYIDKLLAKQWNVKVKIITGLRRSGKFTLSLDDRSVTLPATGEYKIKKAPFSVQLMRKKGMGFASVLRDKLLWSAEPANQQKSNCYSDNH